MLTLCEGNSTLAHASPAYPDTQAGLTLGVQKRPGHGPQLWRQPGCSSEEYGREHSQTQQKGVQTQAPSQTALSSRQFPSPLLQDLCRTIHSSYEAEAAQYPSADADNHILEYHSAIRRKEALTPCDKDGP